MKGNMISTDSWDISRLNTALNTDEVLAVAYEYTLGWAGI